MLPTSKHLPWMEVASAGNATVANKCHCNLDILSPNLNLVQWDTVATGLLFRRWACQLNYWFNAYVQYQVTLRSPNVSRTAHMPHLDILGKLYDRPIKYNRKGSDSSVYCTDIENRWITPKCHARSVRSLQRSVYSLPPPRIRGIRSNYYNSVTSHSANETDGADVVEEPDEVD